MFALSSNSCHRPFNLFPILFDPRDLSQNRISVIEPGAFNHTTLRTLGLRYNLLTEVPSPLPPSLVNLDLDSNLITEVRASTFSALKNLQSLQLGRNRIEFMFLAEFSGPKFEIDQNPCSCTRRSTLIECDPATCTTFVMSSTTTPASESTPSSFAASSSSSSLPITLAIVAGIMMIVLGIVMLVLLQRRRRHLRRAMKPSMAINELNEMRSMRERVLLQVQLLYSDLCAKQNESALEDRELEREDIRLGRILGSGNFGVVYSAQLNGHNQDRPTEAWTRDVFSSASRAHDSQHSGGSVAVKKLPASAGPELAFAFWLEARLMGMLRHPHIVHCHGYVLESAPLLLVMELYSGGSLLSYVRERGKTREQATQHGITTSGVAGVGQQIASACEYLASLKIVHRDLAARNVLVSADGISRVALGDFGGARHLPEQATYYRQQGLAAVPVRWMSPEALLEARWTTASDVWAFGVLMWETASLGERPYRELQSDEVAGFLQKGKRLPQPILCTEEMYALFLACWAPEAQLRPSFEQLHDSLRDLARKTATAAASTPSMVVSSSLLMEDDNEEESYL
eukprot:m.270364 g.270364  ORF g.270364 m.270364 type:complete len:572 (-) comp11082_c0_seq45:49-1764(-)